METDLNCTPPELLAVANNATANLLPDKSSQIYEKQYKKFMDWCQSKNVKSYTENIFLAYFSEQLKLLKATTLWSVYSMLKSNFIIKHNINISSYNKLIAFIKKQNVGYKPKKSSIFTREEVNRFLLEAPNDKHLMQKVCLIIGIAGACRIDELKKMSLNDIQDKHDLLIITIPDSKTGKRRVFTVTSQMYENLNPINIYRQYISLRPSHTPHNALFIFYRLGRCSVQKIGIHTFGKIPKLIATYLQLPNVDSFTGHAFRRTSASLLADTGSDVLTLKQHGGWKSTSVAEGYVESSISRKQEIAKKILQGSVPQHSCSFISATHTTSSSKVLEPFNISHNENCTITVNISRP